MAKVFPLAYCAALIPWPSPFNWSIPSAICATDGQKASEGCADTEWWVCTQGSCAGLPSPAGPGEVLLRRTSLTLKEMNMGLWGVEWAHRARANLRLCPPPRAPTPKKGKDTNLLAFNHNIFSPYGQPSSWRGATVKCAPPSSPPDSPLIFRLSSSSLKVGQPPLWT